MIFDKKKYIMYRELENRLSMKRLLNIFLCFLIFCSPINLSARSKLLDSAEYHECYSWETSDAQQKKQAIGMTVTGMVFFFLIAIISGSISSTGDENTTPFSGTTK